ncbi:unnamed protein product [Clavelina lepadiformis]|uniref:ADP-ribosylation factor-like protein 15 n=1 Tax=Clavelina lepadiformis TaxID=159417 RepID=A0ABP0GQU4_CLALP
MAENCGFCCGICRICLYSTYNCCCCTKESAPLREFQIICIGITNSGKSTLLAVLTNENSDTVVPTIGFNIKEIQLPNALLKVKELGGGENIRSFWSRYYDNVQGVVFVIDGLCTHDQLEDTRREIHGAIKHPDLQTLPWMILCNKQDLEGASTHHKVIEVLQLRDVMQANSNIIVKSCSKINKDSLMADFEAFSDLLLQFYSNSHNEPGARV